MGGSCYDIIRFLFCLFCFQEFKDSRWYDKLKCRCTCTTTGMVVP